MSQSSSKEYFKIKTSYCSYYAEVWHQYPNIDKVYFGGKKMCISFSVYFDEPDPNLDALGYDEKCNTSSTMANNIGTKHMLLTSFAFIKHMYATKGVSENFLFKDASTIECNGHSMFLSHFYMLHHNKTWYESKFGAKPTQYAQVYNNKVLEWKLFLKTKPSPNDIFDRIKNVDRKEHLTKLYSKYLTIGEFIKATKDMDCSVYWKWGDKVIDTVFQHILVNAEWAIDASKLKKPEIKVANLGTSKPNDMFIHTGGSMHVMGRCQWSTCPT